jgi:hypothetical protein
VAGLSYPELELARIKHSKIIARLVIAGLSIRDIQARNLDRLDLADEDRKALARQILQEKAERRDRKRQRQKLRP